MAVAHADAVLQWRENLGSEEMPPEWMWPFPSELDRWFANVEEDRKARSSGEAPLDRADDDDYARRR